MDGGKFELTAALHVALIDVNEAPSDVALESPAVAENSPAGTHVSVITVEDEDVQLAFRSHSVSVVGFDSERWAVLANSLLVVGDDAALNFESASVAQLGLQVIDGPHTLETYVTVEIEDVNEPIVGVHLASGGSVVENAAHGTAVGVLTVSDPDVAPKTVLAFFQLPSECVLSL